jgi:hypothetical protein
MPLINYEFPENQQSEEPTLLGGFIELKSILSIQAYTSQFRWNQLRQNWHMKGSKRNDIQARTVKPYDVPTTKYALIKRVQ